MTTTSLAISIEPLRPYHTITLGMNTSPNPIFLTWFRQDKLIQNALMSFSEPTIAPTVAAVDLAKSA